MMLSQWNPSALASEDASAFDIKEEDIQEIYAEAACDRWGDMLLLSGLLCTETGRAAGPRDLSALRAARRIEKARQTVIAGSGLVADKQ
jgi:hypothetical protein